MANIMAWVYQMMGADVTQPLRVFRNGPGPNENMVFNAVLTRTRFARGMQRAIREYAEFSHRTIEGFYWTSVSTIRLIVSILRLSCFAMSQTHHFGSRGRRLTKLRAYLERTSPFTSMVTTPRPLEMRLGIGNESSGVAKRLPVDLARC